jgi:molybdopterin synthase catalytic subunit
MTSATAITSAPCPVEAVLRAVEGQAGAVTTFVRTRARPQRGRKVLWLDYEAYAPLAEKALGIIVAEAGSALDRGPHGHPPPHGPA